MRSIKWKLIAMYLGLVLIVMIVSGTYILLSLRNIEIDKSRAQLESYAEKINEQVVESVGEENFQAELMKTVTNAVGIQGNILDANGDTIASTTELKAPYPTYTDQAIIAAMNGMTSFSSGKRSTDSLGLLKEWMSYAMPAQADEDGRSYIVYTRLDAGDMQASLNQTTQTIVAAVAIALFLAAIMGYVFAQTLTGPILALTKGAKSLAEGGGLNQSLKVRSSDEIGQLTSSFNYMASELTKNMSEISREKNRLEILLHNMSDGVISFSRDGDLMLANAAATEMLGVEEMTMDFSQFIRAYDINSSVYLDMGNEPSKKVIFPVGKQFINANFSPYYDTAGRIEGVVVVLQDITEQKKLDDMRKEFVANVSHELRTPLTTVKSYTETLIEGAIEDREIALDFLRKGSKICIEKQHKATGVGSCHHKSRLPETSGYHGNAIPAQKDQREENQVDSVHIHIECDQSHPQSGEKKYPKRQHLRLSADILFPEQVIRKFPDSQKHKRNRNMVHGSEFRQGIMQMIRHLPNAHFPYGTNVGPQLFHGKIQEQNVIASDTLRKITHGKKGRGNRGSAKVIQQHYNHFRQRHQTKNQNAGQYFH